MALRMTDSSSKVVRRPPLDKRSRKHEARPMDLNDQAEKKMRTCITPFCVSAANAEGPKHCIKRQAGVRIDKPKGEE